MKLYTEEEIKVLISALNDVIDWDEDLEDEWDDCGYRAKDAIYKFSQFTPIELPSDEEIENASRDENIYNNLQFRKGAKWMKQQILNQNK